MMTLNHGFSAVVCGQVVMPLLRRRAPLAPRAMGWAFFLGGMMPDLDILSKLLWGRGAYFAGLWYSHRQATHSVLGTLLLAMVAALLLWRPLTGAWWGDKREAAPWLVGCFWCGGLLHIVGDLFTPGMRMPVAWPLDGRWGGFSHIGWFTPYLLVLFVTTLAAGWLLARAGRWWPAFARWSAIASWALFATATWRWLQFLVTSRYESRWQWAELQRTLLPDMLVDNVTRIVGVIWYWLTG